LHQDAVEERSEGLDGFKCCGLFRISISVWVMNWVRRELVERWCGVVSWDEADLEEGERRKLTILTYVWNIDWRLYGKAIEFVYRK